MSSTERLSLNIRMRKLCTLTNHCLKCGITPVRVILILWRSGKVLDYIDVCSFLDDDQNPRIGEMHGGVGIIGGGSGREHVVQVDGDVDVAALGDIDES